MGKYIKDINSYKAKFAKGFVLVTLPVFGLSRYFWTDGETVHHWPALSEDIYCELLESGIMQEYHEVKVFDLTP